MTSAAPIVDTSHQGIEVPMPVRTPNHSPRAWRGEAALRRKQRKAIADALRRLCIRPRLPVRVTLRRVASRRLDDDNLAYAFKSIRDEIAAWLRTNDGPNGGVEWRYGQLPAPKGKRGYQAARITIEEL